MELPRYCGYWKYLAVQKFLKRHSFDQCAFDGCMYDLRTPSGVLVKKPWRVSCINSHLPNVLNMTCDKMHAHAVCTGPELTNTQMYTMRIAGIVHDVIRGMCSHSAQASLPSATAPLLACAACVGVMSSDTIVHGDQAARAYQAPPAVPMGLARSRIHPWRTVNVTGTSGSWSTSPISTPAPAGSASGLRPTSATGGMVPAGWPADAPPAVTAPGIKGYMDQSNPWCVDIEYMSKGDFMRPMLMFWQLRNEIPVLIHVYMCRRIFFPPGAQITYAKYLGILKRRILAAVHPDQVRNEEARIQPHTQRANLDVGSEFDALICEAQVSGTAAP